MSVATTFTRNCPFLIESDILSLSPGLMCHNAALLDTPLEITHVLRKPAGEVITSLEQGKTLQHLQCQADSLGITEHRLTELLGFLNRIGGLAVKRAPHQKPRAMRKRLLHGIVGVHYPPLSWRRKATIQFLVIGVIRACRLLIVVSLAVIALLGSSGLISWHNAIGHGLFGLLLFAMSLIIHELGHVFAVRMKNTEAQVLQAGLRLGIIHQKLPPIGEILSSLAGPLAGATLCATIGITLMSAGFSTSGALAFVVALFHVLGLAPWYGDGASLRNAVRTMRTAS